MRGKKVKQINRILKNLNKDNDIPEVSYKDSYRPVEYNWIRVVDNEQGIPTMTKADPFEAGAMFQQVSKGVPRVLNPNCARAQKQLIKKAVQAGKVPSFTI
jgi:hypothetical protein